MIDISMQTAILIYATSYVLGLVLTSYLYFRIEHQRKELVYFILFNLLCVLGSVLIIFREDVGTFLSIIVSNSILAIGYIFMVYGIKGLLRQKISMILPIILMSIFILLFLYFTYIDFDVVARIYVYNFTIMLISIYGILALNKTDINGKQLMTFVLAFLILSITVRIINISINSEEGNQFLQFRIDSFFVVIVGMANVLVLSGVLSLINFQRNLELHESERSKTSLLSNLPGFAYRCLNDEYWTMKYLSKGFPEVTGYDIEDVLDNKVISFEDIIVEEYKDIVRESWQHVIRNKERYMSEYKINHKEYGMIWVLEQGVGIYDDDGHCVAIEGFISNINSRKNLEDNLEFLSYRDYLTGLYNRRFIEEQLLRLDKSRNLPISVIMGDINGLKFINDSFGHKHGDELIKTVADILRDSLRDHELISRLSGDEFLIILENTSKKAVKQVIERIQNKMKKEEYSKMGMSVSFGYSTKTNSEESLHALVKEAENEMYRQKLYHKPSARRKTVDAVLATLFEKDEESETHSRNVSKYSSKLAKAAGLSAASVKKTATAGLLHDVGKIIIDASILKSDSILTEDEFIEIRKHSEIGHRILYNVEELREVANYILSHHERPDGKGYPNKLKDDEIPFISKIISVCDAYDAMIHKRRYKDVLTKEEAFKELRANAGKQFDEELVDLFIDLMMNEPN